MLPAKCKWLHFSWATLYVFIIYRMKCVCVIYYCPFTVGNCYMPSCPVHVSLLLPIVFLNAINGDGDCFQ